jgi:putative membrane protein
MKTYSFLLKQLTLEKLSILIILILYGVGVWGINKESDYYASLTPVIIGFGGFLVILNTQKNIYNYLYLFFLFFVGFFIEVIGAKTGAIFGWYKYGNNLGIKWMDVPILMGVNWMSLTYGAAMLGYLISGKMFWQWFWAALFMVLIDVFIEPMACKLDFWCWNNFTLPPPQNFAAWFIISYLLSIPFRLLKHNHETRFAAIYFIIQTLFFMLLNLTA